MVDPVKHDSYLDLLELYKRPVINNVSAFCEEIHRLKPNELVTAFHRAQKSLIGFGHLIDFFTLFAFELFVLLVYNVQIGP